MKLEAIVESSNIQYVNKNHVRLDLEVEVKFDF